MNQGVAAIVSKCQKKLFRRSQWKMLLSTMFCYLFYNMGRQNFCFATFGIKNLFGGEAIKVGFIAGAMLFFYGVGQAVNGNLSDKFGARKLIALGMILSCLLNWSVSFSNNFWVFLLLWCVNGYAQSLGFAPSSQLINAWWGSSERGRAFGLFLFSTGLSTVLTFLFCILVLMYFSWEWLFRLPPLLMLVVGVWYYFSVYDKPEDMGFDETNYKSNELEKFQESIFKRYQVVLSNKKFIIASLSMGFVSIARYGLLFWVPMYFIGVGGEDISTAGFLTIPLAIGMAVGSLLAGELSDKIFKSNYVVSSVAFSIMGATLSISLFIVPTVLHFTWMILSLLAGFFIYGAQSPLFALCPQLLGNSRAGTSIGIMNASAYGCAAISEPLIGLIIDNTQQVRVVFVIVAMSCIISVLLGGIIYFSDFKTSRKSKELKQNLLSLYVKA